MAGGVAGHGALFFVVALASCTDAASSLPTQDGSVMHGSDAIVDAGIPRSDAATDDASAIPDTGSATITDAGFTDGGVTETRPGPFDPLPDESEGLTNVSADLEALLENGALVGACDAYEQDPTNRKKRLLCGKSMFFYESFNTDGVPRVFADFLLEQFEDVVGPGFSSWGMVPDPFATDGLPLGLALGKPVGDNQDIDTLAYTCASCHFAQLPDGRYAVGAPNHRFDYGKQILAFMSVGNLVGNYDPNAHPSEAVSFLEPFRNRIASDRSVRVRLLLDLIPLLGLIGSGGGLSYDEERYYATWLPGTQDFLITPLPVDDEVHTISKISALWGLPRAEEQQRHGMPHAMLGWTGTAPSLENFLAGFVVIGDGDLQTWPASRLEPLADYIYSLRAPEGPEQDHVAVETGRQLFLEKGCLDCHSGPRGSGTKLYTYEEIGTDAAMKRWADPELDGVLCCGLEALNDTEANKLKSPRLIGLWAMGAFLHNGSVRSLEDLFCMNGLRGAASELAYGDGGHDYTCASLSPQEKTVLIAYLRSH